MATTKKSPAKKKTTTPATKKSAPKPAKKPATTAKKAAPPKAAAPKKASATSAAGAGSRLRPWTLKTPPGTSEFEAYEDPSATPPALVVRVGKTELRYHLRCIDDLHAMLLAHGDWMPLVFKGGGGSYARLFDGSEKPVSWDNIPWMMRSVATP